MIEFLLRAKCFRRSLVAHLNKIADRKIGERVGISFSASEIFGKCTMSIVWKLLQGFIEYDAIFKCRTHSLAIKWNDCVGRIAKQADLVTVIPRRATNGHKRAGRVLFEILEQCRH